MSVQDELPGGEVTVDAVLHSPVPTVTVTSKVETTVVVSLEVTVEGAH